MAESHRDEIAKLEALFQSNPGGRSFTHLAEAYRKAGEAERALEVVQRGLLRHPEYASAYVVLGRVQQDLGNPEEATLAFGRVLELDPENRVALRALGDLARQGGRLDEALERYRHLRTLDPSDDELEAAILAIEAELRERGPAGGGVPEVAPVHGDAAPPAAEASPVGAADFAGGGDHWGLSDVAAVEPARPAAEDDVPLRLVLDEAGGAAYDSEPDTVGHGGEVVTETMAELYRAQGLPGRAAEIYRALLAERPGDERLALRLLEVEAELDGVRLASPREDAAASSVAAAPAGPEATSRLAPEPVQPVVVEEIEAAWTGPSGARVDDPGLYAWADESAEEDGGRTIGEYFGALLAWRPSALGHGSAAAVAAPAGSAAGPWDAQPMGEPGAAEPSAEPWAAGPVAGSAAGPVDGVAGPEAANGGGAGGTYAPAQAEPAGPAAAARAEDRAPGGDDDLEVFRAWLQSLKR
ncbi:MAG: tetratricopeptide repeat protein [Gemmatimonadetes bacterium]|nr:tetratricopeptide repeat protein [Gemmatimonadota bacterium]